MFIDGTSREPAQEDPMTADQITEDHEPCCPEVAEGCCQEQAPAEQQCCDGRTSCC